MRDTMKKSVYKNYIFDLYGTLVDIQTDEMSMKLWKRLARMYEVYGAVYKPKQLRKAFWKLDQEERKKTRKELGCEYPECQLEKVFLRLLRDDSVVGQAGSSILTMTPEQEMIWAEFMANSFRILSRKYIRLFPNTIQTLERLKQCGCRIYMLSNAQAVFTRPEIRVLGLEPYFDAVYLSSDYGRMKPDPVFLRTLMEDKRLKREDTVMVGNEIESDMRIADSCGIEGILIDTGKKGKKELNRQAANLGIRQLPEIIRDIGEL